MQQSQEQNSNITTFRLNNEDSFNVWYSGWRGYSIGKNLMIDSEGSTIIEALDKSFRIELPFNDYFEVVGVDSTTVRLSKSNNQEPYFIIVNGKKIENPALDPEKKVPIDTIYVINYITGEWYEEPFAPMLPSTQMKVFGVESDAIKYDGDIAYLGNRFFDRRIGKIYEINFNEGRAPKTGGLEHQFVPVSYFDPEFPNAKYVAHSLVQSLNHKDINGTVWRLDF